MILDAKLKNCSPLCFFDSKGTEYKTPLILLTWRRGCGNQDPCQLLINGSVTKKAWSQAKDGVRSTSTSGNLPTRYLGTLVGSVWVTLGWKGGSTSPSPYCTTAGTPYYETSSSLPSHFRKAFIASTPYCAPKICSAALLLEIPSMNGYFIWHIFSFWDLAIGLSCVSPSGLRSSGMLWPRPRLCLAWVASAIDSRSYCGKTRRIVENTYRTWSYTLRGTNY